MRIALPSVILFSAAVTIAGCVTAQTRAELDAAYRSVADLTARVTAAEQSHSADLDSLRAQLAAAHGKLLEVEAKAEKEINASGAAIAHAVKAGSSEFSPLLAGMFPGASFLLGLVGAMAGAAETKLRKAA